MGVLLFFVFRSMAKHLRKVNQMARDEAEAAARSEIQESARRSDRS
jgi:cobalamin biosynthesis protein CobD/CbiB